MQADSLPAEPQGKPVSYPKKPCNLQSQTMSNLSDHIVYPQNENFSSGPTFRVDYLQTCFSKFCTLPPAIGSSSVYVCVLLQGRGRWKGAGSGARLFRVGPELAEHIRISSVLTKLKPPKERHKRNSSKERQNISETPRNSFKVFSFNEVCFVLMIQAFSPFFLKYVF